VAEPAGSKREPRRHLVPDALTLPEAFACLTHIGIVVDQFALRSQLECLTPDPELRLLLGWRQLITSGEILSQLPEPTVDRTTLSAEWLQHQCFAQSPKFSQILTSQN